ncbi:hypothetical protein [Szabonella alba]|uniref:Lipoprotein n=1 Tax=Szabonella alba TaxID=2804194 RepID=A0A8K0V865_9RHOB|nr:hypothetical protein [Szabonella alba]MBL4916041.1 hypothetical protein [Szabonella alba]
MRRVFLCLAALLILGACGAAEPKWAPDTDVAAARYVHPGPATITLYTVLTTRDGSGAHSALMINGSQRVMFDPAGTWHHPRLPERNDVHFGMTPLMVDFYIDYHARETYDVVEQVIEVSPEVAELALQRVMAYGAVPKAQCTVATSSVLRGLPGFEHLGSSWFPDRLMTDFGQIPGVRSKTYTDNDTNDNHGVLLVQAGDPRLE